MTNIQTKALCAIHSKKCASDARSLPETLKLGIFACQAVAQSETCKQLIRKEPEFYGRTKRCDLESLCSDYMTQEIDSLKMCGQGFLEGTGEMVAGILEVIENENRQIKLCNKTIDCKRSLVSDVPRFKNITDKELEKFPAEVLRLERDKWNYNLSTITRQAVKGKTISERAEEIERRQTQQRAEVNAKIPGKSLIAGVKGWLDKKGARLECLDSKTQAEMICWGAAYIIDPAIVGGLALKGGKMALAVRRLAAADQVAPLAMMQTKSRAALGALEDPAELVRLQQAQKKDEQLIQAIRQPAVNSQTLRRHVHSVWSKSDAPVESKIYDTFDEYVRLRKEDLGTVNRRKAEEALANIKLIQEKNGGYFPKENEIRIGEAFTDDALSYYLVVTHELEHVAQNPSLYIEKKPVLDRMNKALNDFMKKKTAEPQKLGENVNRKMEFEAIGAQWDFLQAIPKEVRDHAVINIRANRNLTTENKTALIKDLEQASLSREDYLRTVPKYHGYSHVNGAGTNEDIAVGLRTLAIYGSAVGAFAIYGDSIAPK